MEQSDLREFRFYEGDSDLGTYGGLICNHCPSLTIKNYDTVLNSNPNLLELMEDAAAHFAQVHRKSNDV
jgi:hypothetical protein